jgi:hypothetical protein
MIPFVFALVSLLVDPVPTPAPVISPTPAATVQPLKPPIAIELCVSEVQSATNPNLRVGIGFRDLKEADAVHVEFDVSLMDHNDKVVNVHTLAMDGKFVSNIFIQPRRNPVNDTLLTQPEYPDSSAWSVANHYGSGVERVRCELHAAKFADGTAWTRPAKNE